MRTIDLRHEAIVDCLNRLLVLLCGNTAIVRVPSAIQLHNYSEPQPDFAVLRPRDDFYATARSMAGDVLLVIEAVETSVEYDRDEKFPRYATSGIPEAWLIDITQQVAVRSTSTPRHIRLSSHGAPAPNWRGNCSTQY